MRRLLLAASVLLALAATLTSCANKNNESASTSMSSDSLLSTNPVEQPQGNLTPQEQFNQKPAETPPAVTPTPEPTANNNNKPRHSTTPKKPSTPASTPVAEDKGVELAAGTALQVVMKSQITSKTAQVGDAWTGEVKENVIVGNTVVIPAGSTVNGVVNAVEPAKSGSLASLALAVRSIMVNGKEHMVGASAEPIVAGSTRTRNVGAVAGGAAAGALIGKAAGGGKGALIGGIIGGLTGAGAAKASKGYQVEVKEGVDMTFSVDQKVVVKS